MTTDDITTDDKNRLISLSEASEMYGLTHSYLRNLIHRNRLSAQKIGNAWVTTPSKVEEYIATREKRGAFKSDITLD